MDYFVKDVLSKLYETHIINPTDHPFRPEYGRLVAVLTILWDWTSRLKCRMMVRRQRIVLVILHKGK